MERIADLLEQSHVTFDDLEDIMKKNGLTYKFVNDDHDMVVSDGKNEVIFTVVIDDFEIMIYEAEY